MDPQVKIVLFEMAIAQRSKAHAPVAIHQTNLNPRVFRRVMDFTSLRPIHELSCCLGRGSDRSQKPVREPDRERAIVVIPRGVFAQVQPDEIPVEFHAKGQIRTRARNIAKRQVRTSSMEIDTAIGPVSMEKFIVHLEAGP